MCSNNMIQITGFCYLFLQVCPATFQNLNTIDKKDVILQSLSLNVQYVKGWPDGRGKHIASALDSGATPNGSLCCVLGRDTLISHCSLAYQVTGEPSTKPNKILRVRVTLRRTGFPSREGKGRNSPGRLMTWATRTPRWSSDLTQLANRLGAGE